MITSCPKCGGKDYVKKCYRCNNRYKCKDRSCNYNFTVVTRSRYKTKEQKELARKLVLICLDIIYVEIRVLFFNLSQVLLLSYYGFI